jgi:hypothetical protein
LQFSIAKFWLIKRHMKFCSRRGILHSERPAADRRSDTPAKATFRSRQLTKIHGGTARVGTKTQTSVQTEEDPSSAARISAIDRQTQNLRGKTSVHPIKQHNHHFESKADVAPCSFANDLSQFPLAVHASGEDFLRQTLLIKTLLNS